MSKEIGVGGEIFEMHSFFCSAANSMLFMVLLPVCGITLNNIGSASITYIGDSELPFMFVYGNK